jgi:hypothetical protein
VQAKLTRYTDRIEVDVPLDQDGVAWPLGGGARLVDDADPPLARFTFPNPYDGPDGALEPDAEGIPTTGTDDDEQRPLGRDEYEAGILREVRAHVDAARHVGPLHEETVSL